jgi:hypothetical protein
MTGRTRNRRGDGGLLRADIIAAAIDLLDETGDEHAVTLRARSRWRGVGGIGPRPTNAPDGQDGLEADGRLVVTDGRNRGGGSSRAMPFSTGMPQPVEALSNSRHRHPTRIWIGWRIFSMSCRFRFSGRPFPTRQAVAQRAAAEPR